MHLLCINLLVLVLLPSSLSCDKKAKRVRENFAILQLHMDKITDKLQNLSCPERKYKLPNCTTENTDIVETLLRQACQMQRLKLPVVAELANDVQTTILCTCPKKATKGPGGRSKRRRTPRNLDKKSCKAKAILSSMTVCFQRLNTESADARN